MGIVSPSETCYLNVAVGGNRLAKHATKVSQLAGMDGQNMLPKCRRWQGWTGRTSYLSVAVGRDRREKYATKVSQWVGWTGRTCYLSVAVGGMDGQNILPKCRRWQGWTGETCYLSVAVGENRARRWSKIGAKGVKNRRK